VNQWSRVAEVAGQLEEVYQQGLDKFNAQDYEGAVLMMSQVLDEVLVHSMALHYLSQSEGKLRQKRLDEAKHQKAKTFLTAMRRAHQKGMPQEVIEIVTKVLAVDPESMEARWYRRAAETRLTSSSRSRAGSVVSPREVRSRLQQQAAGNLKPTLVVPTMAPSAQERSLGVWLLAGTGVLFLGLVGLVWGFMGSQDSKAAPVPSTSNSPSKVRVSAFDDDDAVMLNVSPNGNADTMSGPSINSALPKELPVGSETVVRVFGRDFTPGAKLVLIKGSRGIDVLSVTVMSEELIETTLRTPEDGAGRQFSLTVVNPGGQRSNPLQLTLVDPMSLD
jgi:hypothetical protein